MNPVATAARAALQVNQVIAGVLLQPVLYGEWRRPPFADMNERPVEYGFALEALAATAPASVLDVGPGRSSWPHLLANCGFRTTAVDKIDGYWGGALGNRHYRIIRDDITRPALRGTFDAITCLSVLEHIPEHAAAFAGMMSLLRPGGHLILSFPYDERRYCPDVYRVPGASYGANYRFVCQMYSRAEVDRWLAENPGEIVEQRYWEAFTGDLWAHGQRLQPLRPATREGRHHLSALLIRKSSAGAGN